MRYSDLHIETRREAPARAKSAGEALLMRAGYLDAARELTALGELATDRLLETLSRDPGKWSSLGRFITTSDGSSVVAAESGDLNLLVCSNCGYADAQQTARSKKPSPDAEPLLPVERVATPDCHTIESLATFLGISQARTAKALLYVRAGADDLVFVLVRGDMQASETKLRSISGALRAATPSQILAAGAVPGYASPIGLSGVEIIVDDLIPGSPNLVAGANEDGFHLRNTNYGRDYAATRIADITLAQPGDACAQCGEPLHAANGYVVSDTGGFKPLAAVLSLAEKCRDERGLVIPFGMGAFDVHLLHLPSRTGLTAPLAEELYALLERASIPVLYDDRDERAGVKFNDADLIGCPVRITVGEKHANDRMVELKARSQSEIDLTPMGDVVDRVHSLANMNPIA